LSRRISRCGDQMDKQTFYDEKARTYPRHDREANVRYRRALDLAGVSGGAVVLDVGCKFARLRDLLKERGVAVDYYGTDISANTISQIADRDDEHFKVSDVMARLPFADSTFDFVFALEIMEHVESPTSMLTECRRVLKPDGALILSVPNPYCWIEIYGNWRRIPESEGHVSSFTLQTISRLVSFNSMEIVGRCGTFFRVPFVHRLLKNPPVFKSNLMFLTRSYVYKIVPAKPAA